MTETVQPEPEPEKKQEKKEPTLDELFFSLKKDGKGMSGKARGKIVRQIFSVVRRVKWGEPRDRLLERFFEEGMPDLTPQQLVWGVNLLVWESTVRDKFLDTLIEQLKEMSFLQCRSYVLIIQGCYRNPGLTAHGKDRWALAGEIYRPKLEAVLKALAEEAAAKLKKEKEKEKKAAENLAKLEALTK